MGRETKKKDESMSLEAVLRLGLIASLKVNLQNEHLESNKSSTDSEESKNAAAESYAQIFLSSQSSKKLVDEYVNSNIKNLLSGRVCAAPKDEGNWFKRGFRDFSINLLAAAVGVIVGPIIWGGLIAIFGIGTANKDLPDKWGQQINGAIVERVEKNEKQAVPKTVQQNKRP